MDHIGAEIGDDDAITKQVLRSQGINIDDATGAQEEAAKIQGIEWYLALAFLMGSDRSRFGRFSVTALMGPNEFSNNLPVGCISWTHP